METAGCFGISPSSVSRRLVQATARKIQEYLERALSSIDLCAVFLDTIHRGGVACVVAMGLDLQGRKWHLGFWEGATENHELCRSLLADLERRGLQRGSHLLCVTDGGGGIIQCLKERYGKDLVHQRCTLHKERTIQAHLPKTDRQEAHRRDRRALERTRSAEARAAPKLLRKALHSTHPIEAMFSPVRRAAGNILRYRGSKMSQRWLGSCLLHAETQCRRVWGDESIMEVVANITRARQAAECQNAA